MRCHDLMQAAVDAARDDLQEAAVGFTLTGDAAPVEDAARRMVEAERRLRAGESLRDECAGLAARAATAGGRP